MFAVLPPQEHSFTIKVVGLKSGQVFEGSFVYARPTLGINIQIGKTKAFILGGLPVDDDTDAVADMMATLKHTLIKFPEWWRESDTGARLQDLNVLFALMKECNDFEKARDQKKPEVKKDEQAGPA